MSNPKRNHTTKETSGLGYVIEDELVAYALAHLLSDAGRL